MFCEMLEIGLQTYLRNVSLMLGGCTSTGETNRLFKLVKDCKAVLQHWGEALTGHLDN